MKFAKNLLHSGLATLAIIAIVGLLFIVGAIPFSSDIFFKFLIGAVLLTLGQAVFLSAIDTSVIKVGKLLGNALMKKKKVWLIILFGLLFGLVVTIAEPDVQIFVGDIVGLSPFLSTWFLLALVGIACGLFVCLGLYRILKNFSIKWVLFILYAIVLILCFFVPNGYIGISFDMGGVTTGSVTVPFILALTVGICAIRGKNNQDDTFGVIGVISIGAIIAVLVLGIIIGEPASAITHEVNTQTFLPTMLECSKNVALAFAPLVVTFLISQFTLLKLDKKQTEKIIIGFVVSAIGLIIFLTGIYFGFSAMGQYIGQTIIANTANIFIILFGIGIGLCIVFTDPSIVVLSNQVEEITSGIIKKKVVFITLGIGISIAIALAFVHVLFQVNIMYLIIPLYVLALLLNIFIPTMFTALAFDSGGVASGVMTVAFIFPICIGLCEALNIGLFQNGFGVIGLVATVPILAVQTLGLIFKIKQKQIEAKEAIKNEEN